MLMDRTESLLCKVEAEVLQVHSLSTLDLLFQIEADSQISSLCCDSMVLIGTQKGSLCAVSAEEKHMKPLKKLKSPITALFLRESVLGIGTECGSIHVLLIKGTDLETLEERKHTAPVLGIATNGVETYISDMRGRICTFPDQKVYDNFGTYVCYCKYLFASESHFLYCKTREAFAVYLEHATGNPIEKFFFSSTGSVIFVKEKGKVFAYDFNKKSVINEMEVNGVCIYDEERNRLIVEHRGALFSVENAADRNLLKSSMNDVFFKELKIEERVVWSESDFSDEVVRIKRNKNKKTVAYEFVTETKEEDGKKTKNHKVARGKKNGGDAHSGTKHQKKDNTLKSLFSEESDSSDKKAVFSSPMQPKGDAEVHESTKASQKLHHFMPVSIAEKDGVLMCYNTTGYLTSTQDEFFNIVELSYHDASRKSVQIKDTNFCRLGVFSEKAIILGTECSLHFYSTDIEWTHKSIEKISLIGISNFLFAVVYGCGVLRIYKHSGLEIFNCEFSVINSIFCHENVVFILEKETLHKINGKLFTIEHFSVLPNVNWIYVDDYVYYQAQGRVYVLWNNMSLKVEEPEGHPLCVSDGYLVVLSKSRQFYPAPAVEYSKVRLEHNSGGPNVLNCTILERDEERLAEITREAEHAGRNRLAADLKALVCNTDASKDCGLFGRPDTVGQEASEEEEKRHYRERENEFWNRKDVMKYEPYQKAEEKDMKIRTRRYSPFRK